MKWQLLHSERVLDTAWIAVDRQHYRLPSGKEIADYYVVSRRDFVLVVATDGASVVLVRQYRPATDEIYISLPAGYLNDDEPPVTAAARELFEEAGVESRDSKLIGFLDPLPGYVRSRAFVVVADVPRIELTTGDPDEIASVFWASWAEVDAMILDGRIREMQAVSALLLARQHTRFQK